MQQWRRNLFMLACLLLLGGLVVALLSSREPSYAGHSLKYWVKRTRSADSEKAAEAIRKIGTNAIPSLLQWLHCDIPSWKRNAYGLLKYVPFRMASDLPEWVNAEEIRLRSGAMDALGLIGPEAQPIALPALTLMLKDPKPRAREAAAQVIATFRPAPVTVLLSALTNDCSGVRWIAAHGLANMGTNAACAVPSLQRALTDYHPVVRSEATNALKRIAPEVLGEGPRK